MNTQNSNKTCANCKHWFLNPHVEYGDLTKAEGKCLATDTFTRSDNVCNAWELSLLYEQRDELVAKLIERIAELSEQLRWIPVTKRLPEDGVEVFVLVDGCATNGVHCADGHRYLNEQNELVEKPAWEVGLDGETYTGNMYKNITHWMSIPELSEVQK